MLNLRKTLLVILCMGVFLGILPDRASAEITDKHREVVDRVTKRLLAVMDEPVGWEVWPPKVTVIDPGFANAFAGFRTENGVDVPYIEVTVDTIEKIAKFDEETLAFTIGHELGHLYYRHGHKSREFYQKFGNDLQMVRLATDREKELEADLYGMKLAFKAGYTRRGLVKDLNGWRGNTPPYCRFEGLKLNPPPLGRSCCLPVR